MFSKKATKIEEIFTVDLMLWSKCQIDGEDFVNFRDLLRKYELYLQNFIEVIGADRKIVYCVWMVDEDVLFNETWIDENWKQRGKKNLNEKEKLMNSFPTCGVHGVT